MGLGLHKGRCWDLQIRLCKCLILLLNLNSACFVYSMNYHNAQRVLEIFRALGSKGNTFKKVIQTSEQTNTITSGSVSGISKLRCAYKVNKGQTVILVPTLKQNATSISSPNWFQPDLSLSLSTQEKSTLSINYLSTLQLQLLYTLKGESGRARLVAGKPLKGNQNCVISKLIRKDFTCFVWVGPISGRGYRQVTH